METKKVLNQIHDYMDMHHNRFGYVLSETELIMFRRRENGWNATPVWGQLDFSPNIPVQGKVEERNGVMVLWYFYMKYATLNQDEGLNLPSFYEHCPSHLGGGKDGDGKIICPQLEVVVATPRSGGTGSEPQMTAESDVQF